MVSPQALENHPYRKGPPDEIGLAVAQAAQDAARPAVVILFGSRARGDWREHSDVDLLVITEEADERFARGAAYGAARNYCQLNKLNLDVNVIDMSRAEFDRCRRAKQHIAGQADTYGVVMSGEELEQRGGYEDEYPGHWPETVRRIRGAESWLQDYGERVESDHWNQQLMGFAAQQAVENALKAVLSSHNEEITYTHNLKQCWEGILRLESGSAETTELLEFGRVLFAYVDCPNPTRASGPQDWLTMYAVIYRYQEPDGYMSRSEKSELYDMVKPFVGSLLEHAYHLSGTTVMDVYPEGLRPWERHHPEVGT